MSENEIKVKTYLRYWQSAMNARVVGAQVKVLVSKLIHLNINYWCIKLSSSWPFTGGTCDGICRKRFQSWEWFQTAANNWSWSCWANVSLRICSWRTFKGSGTTVNRLGISREYAACHMHINRIHMHIKPFFYPTKTNSNRSRGCRFRRYNSYRCWWLWYRCLYICSRNGFHNSICCILISNLISACRAIL